MKQAAKIWRKQEGQQCDDETRGREQRQRRVDGVIDLGRVLTGTVVGDKPPGGNAYAEVGEPEIAHHRADQYPQAVCFLGQAVNEIGRQENAAVIPTTLLIISGNCCEKRVA